MADLTIVSDDLRLMCQSDSPYLKADDLLDQEVTVTIVSVVAGTVENPGTKKKSGKAIVTLKGWDKPFACNITNARTIASIHGTFKASGLVGKRITLYAAQNIRRPDGTSGPAIRVRPQKPANPGVPQSHVRMMQAPKPSETQQREPGDDHE